MTVYETLIQCFYSFHKEGLEGVIYSKSFGDNLTIVLREGFRLISSGATPIRFKVKISALKLSVINGSEEGLALKEVELIELAVQLLEAFHHGPYVDIVDAFNEYGSEEQIRDYIPNLLTEFEKYL